jgi:hypothetical protein
MVNMNKLQVLSPVLMLVLLAAAQLGADTFEDHGLYPATVVISDHSFDTFQRAKSAVERSGARGLHYFPGEVIFGYFPAGFGPGDLPDLDVLFVRSADDPAIDALGPIERGVVRSLFNRKKILEGRIPADVGPIDDKLIRVPPEIVSKTKYTGPLKGSPSELQEDRNIQQNSEFLLGSVLINIILPESKMGSENWTDDEIAGALSGVAVGITEYQQHALWTDLNFTYNYKDFERIPVSVEPIETPDAYDYWVWIPEIFSQLGYTEEEALLQAHSFNNDMRSQFRTDWVYTVFIVDATSNECWEVRDYVAYSYLGGPYMVIPYPACRFGYDIGFAHVFIHEMSHGFWALDEYSSAMQTCGEKSGYLAYSNRNTVYMSCQEVVPCIMNNATLSSPLPVCYYTRGQVGLGAKDYYWGVVPEIYNMPPAAEFVDESGFNLDTVFVLPYEAMIDVWNDAVPNLNPYQQEDKRIDYAAKIKVGYYWVNDRTVDMEVEEPLGGWTSDNRIIQSFPGLEPGESRLYFEFENNVGLTAQIYKKVVYVGIKYYFTELEPSDDEFDVSWSTGAKVFGAVFDVMKEDITAGGGESVIATVEVPEQSSSTRNFYRYCDRDIEPAHRYRYRVMARFDVSVGGRDTTFHVPTKDMYEISLIPHGNDLVSYLLPNPTPSGTSITVDIPKSYYDPAGAQENGTLPASAQNPLLVEVLTPVDISVYNIKGQRIATVFNGKLYGKTKTFQWNGLDGYGQLVASGVYFMRVQAGDRVATKKVVIVR